MPRRNLAGFQAFVKKGEAADAPRRREQAQFMSILAELGNRHRKIVRLSPT
jgi:hypothetical protein